MTVGTPDSETTVDTSGRPRFLYRYRPLSNEQQFVYLERIVVHSRMYAASRTILNDPLDCEVRILWDASIEEFYAQRWDSYCLEHSDRSKEELRPFFEKWHRKLVTPGAMDESTRRIQKLVDSFGVICFSPSARMESQWRRYASGGKGVCLAFDLSVDPDFQQRLVPVEYVDELPNAYAFRDSYEVQVRKCLYTKTSAWSSEQEWRALFPDQAGTEVPFKAIALAGIVVGERVDAEAAARIIEMAERSCARPWVHRREADGE